MPRIPLTFEQIRERVLSAITDAQAMASDATRNDPGVIHDLRTTGKRLRAWGRLMREVWGDETWRTTDHWVRDICRLLASPRDQHVQQQTLNQLAQVSEDRQKPKTMSSVAILQERWTTLETQDDQPADAQIDWKRIADLLSFAYEHWLNHPMDDLTLKQQQRCLATRLQHTYAKARRLGKQVQADTPNSDPVLCHRFRKWVKHLLYQLELLAEYNPENKKLNKLRSKLKTIADDLGDHHDLAELSDQIHEHVNQLDDKAVKRVINLTRQQQSDLLAHAMKKFRQVFEEKSEIWVKGLSK
ncbi:MAG: CHAD domain-containing protein [Phycisphaeraceae bacterium JB051]